MIVQDNTEGPERFVITMAQHTAFADKLASQFGNTQFSPITDPSIRYVIAHHDAGWLSIDDQVHINPETGFPYHLANTPFEFTSQTMRGSPDFNAKHSALAGLISSMHTAGLLNGRYGLAPPGILARFEGEKRKVAKTVLEDELARQEELKTELDVEESAVWTAYKQLQFFDMLSLYFHSKPQGGRGEDSFPDVPTKDGKDVVVQITEQKDSLYALDPFPFATDTVSISFEGRWMGPVDGDKNGRDVFQSLPLLTQTVTLKAA